MEGEGTYVVKFDGAICRRAFWIYVFEAVPHGQDPLLYVGRTGDSSSFNAQAPFKRLWQHLDHGKTTSQLRQKLAGRELEPEDCRFRFVAHGPVLAEAEVKSREAHYPLRDLIAAVEKELADRLAAAGYDVLNTVNSKKALDTDLFGPVLAAFSRHFPKLGSQNGG